MEKFLIRIYQTRRYYQLGLWELWINFKTTVKAIAKELKPLPPWWVQEGERLQRKRIVLERSLEASRRIIMASEKEGNRELPARNPNVDTKEIPPRGQLQT